MEALSHEAQLPRYKRDLRRKLLKLRHLFVYLRQKVGNDVCVCVLKEIDHGWREEREREGGGKFQLMLPIFAACVLLHLSRAACHAGCASVWRVGGWAVHCQARRHLRFSGQHL